MTETLQRPSRPLPPRGPNEPAAPGVWVDGAATAARAAASGALLVVVPVLLLWWADNRSGSAFADALRAAGQLWLVGHGAGLTVPGGEVGLTPLALLAVPLLLLWRAGRRRAHARGSTSRADIRRLAVAVAVPYSVVALLVAILSENAEVRPSLLSSLAGGFLLALAGVAAGGLSYARLWRAAWLGLPERARRVAGPAALASAVLAGAGALLVGASLALHLPQATDLAAASAPGPVAGAGLLLAGLAFVPNAVVWGVAWLVGPGFAVGVGTTVGPFSHDLGAVPAVPLLAALPGSAAPGWVGVLALAVPLAAGVLVGRLVARRAEGGLAASAVDAVGVGLTCGVSWLLLAALSAGAVGGQRLAEVGPAALPVGLAVTVLIGLPAALTAVLLRYRAGRAA